MIQSIEDEVTQIIELVISKRGPLPLGVSGGGEVMGAMGSVYTHVLRAKNRNRNKIPTPPPGSPGAVRLETQERPNFANLAKLARPSRGISRHWEIPGENPRAGC